MIIQAGEIVKIKVRTNDFEDIKSNTYSDSFLGWTCPRSKYVKFYTLEHQGKVLIEKSFLKK